MSSSIVDPIHVCWNWSVQSRPEDLWPYISNTDRFNRDSAVPSIEQTGQSRYRKLLSLEKLGVKVEWEEEPFEWVRPERFGVVRRYLRGPLAEMRVLAELATGNVRYQVWATPRNKLGGLAVRLQLFESAMRFRATVRKYDRFAKTSTPIAETGAPVELAPRGRDLLQRTMLRLMTAGLREDLVRLLGRVLQSADERDLIRMRPYAFADQWRQPRRDVLELFLHAANLGLLQLQWDLMCPLCRGAKQSSSSLDNVTSHVHCDACQIDFSVDFGRSVEVTFRPSPKIREITLEQYCVGGPQTLPHIVVQQIVEPGAERILRTVLEPGAYRFRRWGSTSGQPVRVLRDGGQPEVRLDPDDRKPIDLAEGANVHFKNASTEEQVLLIERMEWNDQAAPAADVTSLQTFRDLFGPETLRPSEQIEVNQMTVLCTKVAGLTAMCRELGDAAAFVRVSRHFDVIVEAVNRNGGAMVKTVGDATMSVFRKPLAAVIAANEAMRQLADDPAQAAPVHLKAGVHCGPMIAVTANERLDYFGATVSMATELADKSDGRRAEFSDVVAMDPEVAYWIQKQG